MKLHAAILTLALSALPAAGAETDAWGHLASVRAGLAAASPLAAEFVQSYTPSGFSVADQESGVLAMRLAEPGDQASECLRWDYREPFPKGFLLCDRIAWSWNPGEESGRRQLIGRRDGFGLDLLRLSVDELRRDYRASLARVDDGRLRVTLVPTGATASEIRDATIELDSESRRLLALSYHDAEGNRTRFELGAYRAVEDPEPLFSPPAGVAWLDE